MTDHTHPWHTLTVTSTYFHDDPMCDEAIANDGNCPGHDATDTTVRERENEYELSHPEDCPERVDPCCCKRERVRGEHLPWIAGSVFSCACEACRPFEPCPACEQGSHDDCLERGARCWTERSVLDGDYSDQLDELTTGAYRVRMSGGYYSTADGEDYDEEMTIEAVS